MAGRSGGAGERRAVGADPASRGGPPPGVDTICGGRNLVTPHLPERYGDDLLVVRPGRLWEVSVIVAEPGQTVAALGGERLYPYATPGGGFAQGLELRPGDEATLVRTDLPHGFAEWSVRRCARNPGPRPASHRTGIRPSKGDRNGAS